MLTLRRLTILVFVVAIFGFLTWLLPTVLNPTPPTKEEKQRDINWIRSSPNWLDRTACRWLSLCGLQHVRWDPPNNSTEDEDGGELRRLELRMLDAADAGIAKRWMPMKSEAPHEWAPRIKRSIGDGKVLRNGKYLQDVPDYVLAHAPLVHLYSGENFWPADIAEHARHMVPVYNRTALNSTVGVDLWDLQELNSKKGMVYLTSADDVESRPEWLHSHVGKPQPFRGGEKEEGVVAPDALPKVGDDTTWFDVGPDHPLRRISDPRKLPDPSSPGFPPIRRRSRRSLRKRDQQQPLSTYEGHKPDADGYSKAPAVLVMVDKGSGILDAFWFFFYSYNLGQTVAGIRFGNHVGDWEHCMTRFENGVPRAVFFSEHAGGQAYAWEAVEKRRQNYTFATGTREVERPVIYSAVGSHAMYAAPGDHPYVLPFKLLRDQTDRGPLWDPARNQYAYHYDLAAAQAVAPDEGSTQFPMATFQAHNATDPHTLVPAASNPDAPTGWFHFASPWGDEFYSLGDRRQWRLFGQYHYVTGPLGPKFKNLAREKVCERSPGKCTILRSIDAGKRATWYS